MTPDRKTVRTKRGHREYTCLGCPLTRNRTPWCFRLCDPDDQGHGRCGRVAPHGLTGSTHASILKYTKQQLATHCEKLERMYLSAPCSEYYDLGIRIVEGEAEVMIPIEEKFQDAAGTVHDSVCFTAMSGSALSAVNSIVDKLLVVTANFDIHIERPIKSEEIIARSRFVGMSGDQYLAESILTDPEGNELGRGNGAFVQSEIPLSAEIGYE